jgi:hypothetical protein
MDENPFYRRAAKAISDLINQRPRSPTIDEITQIIEEEWWKSQALEEDPIDRIFKAKAKALRKQKHPSPSRKLRSFLDN